MTAIPLEKRYGRLTVLGRARVPGQRDSLIACACDCGTARHLTRSHLLRSGQTRSCGCLRIELARERIVNNRPPRKTRREANA